MQDNQYSQTFLAQSIAKVFVEKKNPDFQVFIQVWRQKNGMKIHSLPSPNSLVFGRCQTAYQVFLSLILIKKSDIEIAAGLYGIYLLFETQSLPKKEPILITSDQFIIFKHKITDFHFLHSIFNHLLRSNAFVFSSTSYAIPTQYTEFPPQTVLSEKPPFSHIMQTKRDKYINRKHHPEVTQIVSQSDDEASYKALFNELFQTNQE